MSAHRQDLDWQRHARCRGMSTAIFFVPDRERGRRKAAREEYAKHICAACLVRRECLRHAVAAREPHGVWGAMTPDERVAISLRKGDGESVPGRRGAASRTARRPRR
ncbi:WhiB family transcriptional regulator [Mycolicibacterium holsaticum]|nr:WhiB family transcriptional regulator [Mycolicibacterium holsaticum]MDA4106540.1 transcription factor WhiB [Mycolicibacterium holsaticum DSM 44478 = JCM 12374]QZA13169.1 WhiB family transcriptional regulator [Mycolicibacterium holsaticum DSM 44478 = JCM 12374]UNC09359.1 WhiB family transcriptional regulator [Mycolicibacterium holsaticum DSM 44478 = JCM 12374]